LELGVQLKRVCKKPPPIKWNIRKSINPKVGTQKVNVIKKPPLLQAKYQLTGKARIVIEAAAMYLNNFNYVPSLCIKAKKSTHRLLIKIRTRKGKTAIILRICHISLVR